MISDRVDADIWSPHHALDMLLDPIPNDCGAASYRSATSTSSYGFPASPDRACRCTVCAR
jgi:hypothetical protein